MWIFKKDEVRQSQPADQVRLQEDASDAFLLDAIAHGEVWAIESLYQRYHRLLYSFVYRMVTDQQVAEDLLQETFFAVWRRAISYTPQSGEVRSWLVSIIHHRAIDYLRGLRRRSELTKVPLEEVDLRDGLISPDVWDEVWRSHQRLHVREALMAIPKEQRMVIELAYFQGWTHAEIAEGCQLPLGTVKARMRLGLLHMKRILEQKGLRDL